MFDTHSEIPILTTAIHDGHALRDELVPFMKLSDAERLREEDPFTATWTQISDWRVIGNRSRFEVDLNRPHGKAVYQRPEDCWGLEVWSTPLPSEVVARSLEFHAEFYQQMRRLLKNLVSHHGHVVVFDLHSYNHRRCGANSSPNDPLKNPEINVGTGTMDRARWAGVVERFMHDLGDFDFLGRRLDVRENVCFQGGYFPRWIHEHFPETVCCLPIEVKKFFMDEWTGIPDLKLLMAIRDALASTIPGVVDEIQHRHVLT